MFKDNQDAMANEEEIEIPEGIDLFSDDDDYEPTSEESEALQEDEQTADDSQADEKSANEGTDGEIVQTYELKVNGQIHKVNQEELIKLGQMGMDYDRIRQQRDMAMNAPEIRMLNDMSQRFGMNSIDFLKNFENQINEQRISERANELMEQRGIDEDTALYLAKLEQQQEEQRYQQDLQQRQYQEQQYKQTVEQRAYQSQQEQLVNNWSALYDSFPELKEQYSDFTQFPEPVKQMVLDGRTPLEAYSKYMLDEKNKELNLIKNNNKVKEKSTGSLKANAGDDSDPFLAGLFGD